jgi:hypothetical protein
LWRATQNGFDIHGFAFGDSQWRNQFQPAEDSLNILRLLALNGTDDDVFTTLVPTASLVEHAIGLAHAGRVAQKNLKSRTPELILLGLHLLEESLGTRPC